MSHVAECKLEVKDLSALAEAAEALGFEFREDQLTYKWYGKFLDDWSDATRAAALRGRDPSTFGKCVHALRLKNDPRGYEIGVVQNTDGTYSLLYDAWGGGGRNIEETAGIDLVRMTEEYGAVVATRQLTSQGYEVTKSYVDGHVDLYAEKTVMSYGGGGY